MLGKRPLVEKRPVEVVLTGASTEIRRGIGSGTRVVPAIGEDTWAIAGSQERNVQVIVVDVDRYGLQLVRDLRTVFPSLKIVRPDERPALPRAGRARRRRGRNAALDAAGRRRQADPQAHAAIASIANATAIASSATPSSRRSVSSDRPPVLCAPSRAPGIAPSSPAAKEVPLDLQLRRVRDETRDAEEEADDEVRADGAPGVHPDHAEERGHAERAEDHADRAAHEPDRGPEAAAGHTRGWERGLARTGRARRSSPFQARIAAMPVKSTRSGMLAPSSPPTTAPMIDGGAIHATTRQSTRPSRACRQPPDAAAAALIAMFVPAAAAGFPAAKRTAGRRSVPSTSPTTEPR